MLKHDIWHRCVCVCRRVCPRVGLRTCVAHVRVCVCVCVPRVLRMHGVQVLVDLDCEPPTVIRLELWLKLQANGTSGSPEHSSPEPVSDDRSSSVPRGAGSATWSPPRSGDAGGTTTPQEPRSSADSRAARSGQATGVELLVSHVPVVVLPSAWSDAVSELLPHVERMATANDGQTYDHAAGKHKPWHHNNLHGPFYLIPSLSMCMRTCVQTCDAAELTKSPCQQQRGMHVRVSASKCRCIDLHVCMCVCVCACM